MKSARVLFLGLLCVVACALSGVSAAMAQDPEPAVIARASDDLLSVEGWTVTDGAPAGTTIELRISATLAGEGGTPSDLDIRWPDVATLLEQQLGEDVVEIERVGPAPGQPRQLQVLLRLWDAGEHMLPALEVSAIRRSSELGVDDEVVATATLEGLKLTVPSVLPAEDAEPVASRGEVEWDPGGVDIPLWAWLAGGAVLIALLLVFLWWRGRSTDTAQIAPVIVLPPHERALAALEALLDRGLPQRGEFDPYFVQLSEILRGYIEERFGLHAPERTTEEFLAELMQRGGRAQSISPEHRDLLRGFLTRADLVKFALDVPQVSECADAAHAARRFVDDTASTGEQNAEQNAEPRGVQDSVETATP